MKRTVISLLLPLFLAQAEESCYTLQLFSVPQGHPHEAKLLSQSYPSQCRVIPSGDYTTMRCGCFESMTELRNASNDLKKRFPQAAYASVYRRYFAERSGPPRPVAAPPRASASPSASEHGYDDAQLRLMYRVFTYDGKLAEAYNTAALALRRYPSSAHWHEKMIEVAKWQGKNDVAVEHMRWLYARNGDPKLRRELIDFGLSNYRYEDVAPLIAAQLDEEPSDENIETMLYVNDKLGLPEASAALLESLYAKRPERGMLFKRLRLQLATGDLEAADRTVEQIRSLGVEGVKEARTVADYFATTRRPETALEVLASVVDSAATGDTDYFVQLSDLGWYLHRYPVALRASRHLYETGHARQIDYERIIAATRNSDPAYASEVAQQAYYAFGSAYLFYTHASLAIDAQSYAMLESTVDHTRMHPDAALQSEALYWIVRSQVATHFGRNDEAIAALMTALSLEPDNVQVMTDVLWMLNDNNDAQGLRRAIFKIEEHGHIPPRLYLPFAAGHFRLQATDSALGYVLKLLDTHPDDIDLRFLYAYILQVQNEEGAFMRQMRAIMAIMQKKMALSPALFDDPEFRERYLKAAIFLLPPDRFETEMHAARPILSQRQYGEIALFWAIRNNATELAHLMVEKFERSEAWMRLYVALNFENRPAQQVLLQRYTPSLPIRDRVTASENVGEPFAAYGLAFKGLESNSRDELLYLQLRDLAERHADRLVVQSGYRDRSLLQERYIQLRHRGYWQDGISWLAEADATQNRLVDTQTLTRVPSNDVALRLGLRKAFDRGHADVKAGSRHASETFGTFDFDLYWNFSRYCDLEAGYHYNARAEESLYLLTGGKKTGWYLRAAYTPFPSTTFAFRAEHARYTSQDDVSLGTGSSVRAEVRNQLRGGYPDLAALLFFEASDYYESGGSRGNIDYALTARTAVLPERFYNLGAALHWGVNNDLLYSRVWRPFAEITPYYNSVSEGLNAAFTVGTGGALFNQDHASVGVTYDQTLYGIQEKSLELYIRYKVLY